MNELTLTRKRNQRGYTLMEILVAVSIFAIVILVALLLYDRSNQVFKQSVESSDMQQSTRVAFDKLTADLRMAGFDYDRDGTPFGSLAATWKAETTYTSGMLVEPTNPNGHTYICITGGKSGKAEPGWPVADKDVVTESGSTVTWQENGTMKYQQPDEQIEYAGSTAVAFRANFNYETATGPCTGMTPCEGGREPTLESTEFPVVTTANNEIVIYALKPVKWAKGESADDLVFYADVATPRKANPATDGKESKITITGVELCDAGCNSPPYTLYRYTLDEKTGLPDAGTPVAENIREVRYRYFTTTDASDDDEIKVLPNGDGMYDGGDPNLIVDGRDTRGSIRAVEIALVGMNPQPDYQYTDASDAVAPNYRKLELKSLITPRNAGRRGMKEYSTDKPGEPTLKSICAGACNAVFATWTAPATGGDIESYAILYDTDPCGAGGAMPTGGYQYSEEVGLNLSGSVGRYITPGQSYSFAVQAISKWGAQPSKCMGPIKVLNRTKPEPPKEFIATYTGLPDEFGAQQNRIDLYFTPSGANVAGEDELSCNTGTPLTQEIMPPAEKRYYEIWRGRTATFQPEDADAEEVLNYGTATQPVTAGDYVKWSDLTAANCTDYYYRIRIVDYCAREKTWNESGNLSQGESEWFPALTDDGIRGYADATAEPEQPSLTMEKAECTGANCELTFTWPAVTKNTADEPIFIDKYILRVFESKDGVTFPSAATDVKNITGGDLTTKYTVKDTALTQFKLVALDCKESVESEPVIYPCVFNAGTLTANIASGAYGGTGASGNPYIIENAIVSATTTNKVSEFRMAIYDVADGSSFATANQAGSANSASFSIPNTPDGRLMRVVITAVDDKNCTKVADLYVIDSAAPACSITDSGTDSSIVTVNKDNVVYTLKNTSSNDLILKKVVVNFDIPDGDALLSVSFNGSLVTTGCAKATVVVTAPASQTIAKNSSTYKLTLNYKDNNLQNVNPTNSVCLIYQAPTGDILSCQIHPSAATCTEPASTCN